MTQVDERTAVSIRAMQDQLRWARTSAVLPIVVGVAIFLLWLLVGGGFLMFAGMCWTLMGCLIATGSIICLIGASVHARYVPLDWHRLYRRSAGVTSLLIVCNFALAWGLMEAALAIMDASGIAD